MGARRGRRQGAFLFLRPCCLDARLAPNAFRLRGGGRMNGGGQRLRSKRRESSDMLTPRHPEDRAAIIQGPSFLQPQWTVTFIRVTRGFRTPFSSTSLILRDPTAAARQRAASVRCSLSNFTFRKKADYTPLNLSTLAIEAHLFEAKCDRDTIIDLNEIRKRFIHIKMLAQYHAPFINSKTTSIRSPLAITLRLDEFALLPSLARNVIIKVISHRPHVIQR